MKKFMKYFYITILFLCVGFVFYGCSTVSSLNAYQIAVENGFSGTEQEWIESLKGKNAYELAVEDGYEGSLQEWLASLFIEGDNAYEIAVKNGFSGTEQEWLASLKGKSAYEIAVDEGFEGNVTEWLTSLMVVEGVGTQDFSAQSLFELGVSLEEYTNDSAGYTSFMEDYLASVKDLSKSTLVEKVAAKAVNQVVSVYTQDGAGAGVIYEINEAEQYAYIITNYHVVVLSSTVESTTTYAPATDIYFYTYGAETVNVTEQNQYDFGNQYYMAEYVGGSADYDLAVLKVTGEYFTRLASTDAQVVTIADTTNLQPGSTAIAVGNPVGEGIAVTSGVVSIDREVVRVSIAGAYRTLLCLRLDASINGGNSGGGVFDIDGNLIGIANAKYSSSEYENIANAILGTNVKNVAENIIHFYELNLEDDLIVDKTVGVHRYLIGYVYEMLNTKNTFDAETFTNVKSGDITVKEIVADSIAQTIELAVDDIVRGLKIKRAGSEGFETVNFDIGYDMNDFMLTVREGDEIILLVDRPIVSGEDVTYQSLELTSFIVDESKYIEYKNNGLVE